MAAEREERIVYSQEFQTSTVVRMGDRWGTGRRYGWLGREGGEEGAWCGSNWDITPGLGTLTSSHTDLCHGLG